jgi:hypothetical protein
MSDTKHEKALAGDWIMHYTNDAGYKPISSQKDWAFQASQPPGDNKFGVYFTTLAPTAPRFSARTKIPKEKQKYVFAFVGRQGLQQKAGGKGAYVLWTPETYVVEEKSGRQKYNGLSEDLP